jgi:hypothetical protein
MKTFKQENKVIGIKNLKLKKLEITQTNKKFN